MNDVVNVRTIDATRLWLTFDDGVEGEYDRAPLIARGGVFAPLADPAFFKQVVVNEDLGTIVWPNGGNVCPDVLYAAVTGQPIAFGERTN